MKSLVYFSTMCLLVISQQTVCAQDNKADKEVRALLAAQAEDWNAGDIERFMEGYWHSEQLTFIGSRGVTKGWDQTLANYKKSYPNKKAMGHLEFDLIDVDVQSKKLVSVMGKYILNRESGEELTGHFLLIVKKIKGKWLIVADHSS